ncbi:transposase [Nostoc sp. CHAB 5834]|nr:transposase [Nostoc sp. CHAB 5834]
MAKKSTPNRKFTHEFKPDVLRLVANGESILGVAQKMGISDSIIHAWRAAEKKIKGGENQLQLWKKKSSRSVGNSAKLSWKGIFYKKAVAIFSRIT